MLVSQHSQDPFQYFQNWYQEALQTEADVDAMILATATPDGRPSARTVLFKKIANQQIIFFTNYDSRKAQELLANPNAAIVFYWPTLYRQVRMEGVVQKIPRAESEAYFASRPRDSQLAAWSSPQSQVIKDHEFVLARFKENEKKFADQVIPCPEFWGGFQLMPTRIEFWQGEISQGEKRRLHQRTCYLQENKQWRIVNLAP